MPLIYATLLTLLHFQSFHLTWCLPTQKQPRCVSEQSAGQPVC